ncbi:MAG: SDR family NAD(P)-dependent oxidoreductase [Candidatus Hodarchaeales archaeon]|jgi:NAD(P)-dependent dehydrogenase (short-subunit alcohol dehydrogenase family)
MKTKGPILVTGASSGIGRVITEFLAQKGNLVYACARKESDIKNLNSLENVFSFRLDVTKVAEVQQVVDNVKKEERGLYALINNAGIVDFWPILATTEEILHRVFDVNVYGPLRITNALIPFLIESGGRIVNISSSSGLSTPLFAGAYSMSKYALEAWSNALSHELKEVKVSIIEPTSFSTSIVRSVLPILEERVQQLSSSIFNEEFLEVVNYWKTQGVKKWENLPEPKKVALTVDHALFNDNPKRRYFVTAEESIFKQGLKSIMTVASQIYLDNEHGITKKDLHDLLESVLGEENEYVRTSVRNSPEER